MKELDGFTNVVSAARSYFQTRLAAGEDSIVLSLAKGRLRNAVRSPEEALVKLQKKVAACKKCPLHRTRTNVVFGTGSGKTGLVFVGEAPGRDEDLQGKPFVGRAGQLLTRIIEAVKLDREDVYITNVIKCRPEGNRDPLPQEIELCSVYLAEQLEILKPKAICALGRFAAQAMSGLKLSMADYRNESLFYGGTRVIATYHPAACLRNPSLKRPVWEDVQKLMEVCKNA
ncbi:MAG: uracil-DNA glycosylase [Candidatus Eisenbacteria bacterium]|nr:uracil-DNA glycosylase [Candidatus Eisenbacteria bacterium]